MSSFTTLVEQIIFVAVPHFYNRNLWLKYCQYSLHTVAMFATFSSDAKPSSTNCFLVLYPLVRSILWVLMSTIALWNMCLRYTCTWSTHFRCLAVYLQCKTFDNVVAITGDNTLTNKALARMLGPVFSGCHSHKYTLTMMDILLEHKPFIEVIHTAMFEQFIQVPAAKLQQMTHLKGGTCSASQTLSNSDFKFTFFFPGAGNK